MDLNIVLCQPEIPPNTGNISRTCAALGATLHLIHPLGFALNEATVRRAGLDYWSHLKLKEWPDLAEFMAGGPGAEAIWFLSTKAPRSYHEADFRMGGSGQSLWFMFGQETKGLPEDLLRAHPERCLRLPMLPHIRSLNLSNAVAVLAYEAMRQNGFPGLATGGDFPENQA